MRYACLAILALTAAPVRASDKTVILSPTSNWNLDYANERCRLARTFGTEGAKPTVLILDQHAPDDSFRWTLAGPDVARFQSDSRSKVQFGPGYAPRPLNGPDATFGSFGHAIFGDGYTDPPELAKDTGPAPVQAGPAIVSQVSALKAEDRKAITWLRLSRGSRALQLELGPMNKAFEAMNTCTGDLITHWGLNLAEHRQQATAPVWKNRDDVARRIIGHYPLQALRAGQEAQVQLRVMVDAAGQPFGCRLTDITVADNFDEFACDTVMRDAAFEPARTAEGEAIRSFYIAQISYRIN